MPYEFTDEEKALAMEAGGGNPGAISVATRLIAAGKAAELRRLKAAGIRGEALWLAFKNAGEDVVTLADSAP